MSFTRTICISATMLLLAGLVGASGALAAQPEYGICQKLAKDPQTHRYTGAFDDKTCTAADAAGEGKYAAEAVPFPYPFETAGRSATLYYHTPSGQLRFQITCKRTHERGLLVNATEGTLNVTLEECKALNVTTAAKAAECPNLTATVETALVQVAAGGAAGVALYPGFTQPFECAGVMFGASSGSLLASVSATSRGPAAVFTASPATGEQALGAFLYQEQEYASLLLAPVKGPGVLAMLDIGVQATLPLGPKQLVVLG